MTSSAIRSTSPPATSAVTSAPASGSYESKGGDQTGFYVRVPELEFGREHGDESTSAIAERLRDLVADLAVTAEWLERQP